VKFILELWPDLPSDATPSELVRYAVASIARNPDLVWTITDDEGNVVADDVRSLAP
jgi:hypothetical protein